MNDFNNLPPVSSLIPHEEPMILIDRIVSVDESCVHCQVIISAHSQFLEKQSMAVGAWVGIEYMAQTISAWAGYQNHLNNKEADLGFLLGSRRYNTTVAQFELGDTLDIYAEKLMESEGMGAFSCSIKRNDIELVSSQLNVFVPNDKQLNEMLGVSDNE